MSGGIPIIDVAPFLNGPDAQRRRVAAAVNEACSEIGFLLVIGHGIPASLVDDMRRVSTAFFERPLEEKMRYRMPPDRYRGYIALGNEALAYSLDEKTPPDYKESFSIGPVDAPDDAYHRGMEQLATTLMRIFAMALGMDEHYFDDKIDRHITNFSMLHYTPQNEPPLPGQLRAGAHTDYGSLT